jgi:hypothetical protein
MIRPDDLPEPARAFALPNLDGKTVHLEEFKGKMTMQDSRATW